MKKVLFIATLGLSFLNSCNNNDDIYPNSSNQNDQLKEKKVSNKNKIGEEDITKMLENKYKMKIESNLKINSEDINSLNSSLLSNISDNGYKFSVNEREIYAIPFKENKSKLLLSNFRDFQVILENYVDSDGNGKVIITSEEEEVTKLFEKGKLVKIERIEKSGKLLTNSSISARKSPFRVCFDQAYDDICDGFIGCAAWYTSPLPAATALAYCAATT